MQEVTIKFSDPKFLKVLKSMAKYFGFEISSPKKIKDNVFFINGVPIIKGDPTIDISGLTAIFSGKNIDAKELRKNAWNRKK